MQTGTLISGAGHAALVLWVILGDWLFDRSEPAAVEVAEVSLISASEFDAMVAAAPSTPEPAPDAEPAPEPPAPEPAPEAEPEPVIEPPPPVVPDLPAPAPVPEPAPEVEPVPEPLPENNGVADALPLPVNPDPIPEAPLPPSTSPRPRPAPRVAPVPVDTPDPATEVAEAPVEAVTPDPVEVPDIVEPEQPEAQPEEAGTVLETEANRDEDIVASGAPPSSPRPRGRPVRSEAPAEDTAAATPAPTEAPTPETDTDAVAAALAEALAAETDAAASGATNAPQGPPMTSGERDAMRVAVQQCWNVGSLSSDALNTTVVVFVSVAQNGVPDAGSIRMIEATGGSDAGARGAFEAARRAIIRCGARGFPLPPEKYDQWREMELVFNPDGMRMR